MGVFACLQDNPASVLETNRKEGKLANEDVRCQKHKDADMTSAELKVRCCWQCRSWCSPPCMAF